MPKFKILAGSHHDQRTGQTWRRGDIVQSDANLAALFGTSKFAPTSGKVSKSVEQKQKEEAERLAELAIVEAADAAEAEAKDAAEEAENVRKEAEETKKSADLLKRDSKEHLTKSKSKESELGDDVSDDFEDAEEAGVRVFRKDDEFFLVDVDDPSTPLKSDKKLKTPAAVRKAMKGFLKSDDEE